jgi:hypothetical protein
MHLFIGRSGRAARQRDGYGKRCKCTVPTELNMPAVISFRKEKTYKSQDAAIVKNELLDPTRLGLH